MSAVDLLGHVAWTPTPDQVGLQRLGVRIVDAQGRQTVRSWVVDVAAGKRSGCALAAGAAPSLPLLPSLLPLFVLLSGGLVRRVARRWRRAPTERESRSL